MNFVINISFIIKIDGVLVGYFNILSNIVENIIAVDVPKKNCVITVNVHNRVYVNEEFKNSGNSIMKT